MVVSFPHIQLILIIGIQRRRVWKGPSLRHLSLCFLWWQVSWNLLRNPTFTNQDNWQIRSSTSDYRSQREGCDRWGNRALQSTDLVQEFQSQGTCRQSQCLLDLLHPKVSPRALTSWEEQDKAARCYQTNHRPSSWFLAARLLHEQTWSFHKAKQSSWDRKDAKIPSSLQTGDMEQA